MIFGEIPRFVVMLTTWKLPEFEKAIEELEDIACHKIVAYMCAEAVWWRCHRSMISDYSES
jgi:uncharacterized protein (DUF488 family)